MNETRLNTERTGPTITHGVGANQTSFGSSFINEISRIGKIAADFFKSLFSLPWIFCSNKVDKEENALSNCKIFKLSPNEIEDLSDDAFETLMDQVIAAQRSMKPSPAPNEDQSTNTNESETTIVARLPSNQERFMTPLEQVIQITSKRISKMPEEYKDKFWDHHGTSLIQMCSDMAIHLHESAVDRTGSVANAELVYKAEDSKMINRFFDEDPKIVADIILDSIIEETRKCTPESGIEFSYSNVLALIEKKISNRS